MQLTMDPWVPAIPANLSETLTHTCRRGYGFSQVRVRVAKKNPRVTHGDW
jgi:hypothetical protein